ncbi:IPI3 [Mytilus edulis]|uniref:IPI3 n=1 Tax=Mytilus edulis TaxID=6550 RepID=A0A8S3RUZ9_MYTED|nr:IPI3 [Mytilus edulis]
MSTMQEVLVTSDAAGQQWNSSIWDPVAGTSLLTFKGSTSAPHTLSILNNEYILGALPTKSVIQVWSLQKTDNTQMQIVCPGRVTSLTTTPDGNYCIAAVSENIHIWQVCTGHLLTVLSRHYQQIKCIKCTDDGTCFITAGDDNLVIAWNLAKVLADCGNPSHQVEPDHVWSHHSLPVTDLFIGSGGNRARVVSSSLDQTCKMYDLVSGDLLCNLVFDVSITSVTMDTAEYSLFAGGSNGVIHCINMFEMPVQKERHIEKESEDITCFEGHKKQVTCLCVSINGSKLISGSDDCNVKIWDVFSGQCTKTLDHKGMLTNVFLIPTPPALLDLNTPRNCIIKPFQRHLYIPGEQTDESDGTVTMMFNHSEKMESVVDYMSDVSSYLSQNTEISDPEEELAKCKEEIAMLKSANHKLFQFAAKGILHQDEQIT